MSYAENVLYLYVSSDLCLCASVFFGSLSNGLGKPRRVRQIIAVGCERTGVPGKERSEFVGW